MGKRGSTAARAARPGHRNRMARLAADRRAASTANPSLSSLPAAEPAAPGLRSRAALATVWHRHKPATALAVLTAAVAATLFALPPDLLRPSLGERLARIKPAPLAPTMTAATALPAAAGPSKLQIEEIAPLPASAAIGLAPVEAADLLAAIEREQSAASQRTRACSIAEAEDIDGAVPPVAAAAVAPDATDQGRALAAAAEVQTGDLVVYTDGYKELSYPMGDVASLYGVCTDVVVRAYRSIGIDLQQAVKRARVGSGDQSIDHRRVEVLRRLFAKSGAALPVSDIAEDYLPGDIVTYHRPQNSSSQSHIAIVSNRVSRSGRPLIVHNRGWGTQIEDALFVDRITGHYRYFGSAPSQARPSAQGSAVKASIGGLRTLARLRQLRARMRQLRQAAGTTDRRVSLR